MRKISFLLLAWILFSSHDMYLRIDSYFLQPYSPATIQLYNGTFDLSENVIDRNRMADASLVGNGQRTVVDSNQWSENDNKTLLSFTTGDPGTWVAGVSTHPRNIELPAADFNDYLEHDGLTDMLEWRKQNGANEEDAIEQYAKHVKTIFQVGDKKTVDFQTVLGYPIEFVPLSNPYDLQPGDELPVQLLFQGEPLPNQLVYLAYKKTGHSHHSHEHDDEHEHTEEASHQHTNEHDHAHTGAANHEHDQTEEPTAGHSHEHGHSHDHAGEATHEHETAAEHSHTHTSDAIHEHKAAEEESHHHQSATALRTDTNGQISLPITAEGIWYLRTIHLVPSDAPDLTHESNWATLTFEVGHDHNHGEHAHTHHDEHAQDGPGYLYWIGSLVLVLVLFFWFNRKTT